MIGKWLPLAAAILLTGCTAVIHKPVKLPLPPRPALPSVAGNELACLSDEAYARIVERERDYKGYALKLEGIIKANNDHAK